MIRCVNFILNILFFICCILPISPAFSAGKFPTIVGWGDSMTAPNTGYFEYLASNNYTKDRIFINQGIGGQRASQISIRSGALCSLISIYPLVNNANSYVIYGFNSLNNTEYHQYATIDGVEGVVYI